MKNWENLEEEKCPNCNSKLRFRLQGSGYKIKANKGGESNSNKNMYFCSKCPSGFQISGEKLAKIKEGLQKAKFKEFKNDPLFKTGILSL